MSDSSNIEYMTQIWQEGKQFVAHAMPLDVMSSGHTVNEARSALAEAVDLFLATAADHGALADVLEEAGYELKQGHWISPVWVATERQSVAVGV